MSSRPAPAPAPARRQVAAVFGCFGAFWGTWAVAAADIERGLRLSPAGLGLMLSGSVAAGGLAAGGSGALAERWGAARFLSRALVLWGGGALLAAAMPDGAAFIACFVVAMIGAGLVDMSMNATVAVLVGTDTPAMVRFHALFNAGAIVGASFTGALIAGGISWRWSWVATAVLALVLSTPLRRQASVGAGSTPSGRTGHALTAVRRAGLAGLATAFVATAAVEGGIDTWGVLYLRRHLAAGILLGVGAYAMGQCIAVTVRGAGGRATGRVGPRWGMVIGASTAAGGLALEGSTHSSVGAAAGLVLGTAGISLCWPLAMSAAAARAQALSTSPAPLVGALTASGYIGWVAGPALVGTVADAAGLQWGLFLLAMAAAAAAVCLSAIPPPDGRGSVS